MEYETKLDNYFDLLVDEKLDNVTNSPICIGGISNLLQQIFFDLRTNYKGPYFQNLLKQRGLIRIYHWKGDWWPIPIIKLKQLLELWREVCNKSPQEYHQLYQSIFEKADFLKAKCSPVNIKVIKSLTPDLAYFLGVLYADGALRDIWLTFKNEGRFRCEITITDKPKENLTIIVNMLEKIFGIKTNVKAVYGGRWHRILFQSMILHRLLHKLFDMPMGYKKGKLRLPSLVRNSPLHLQQQFLKGFFDGDGYCSIYNTKKRFTPVIAASQSDERILQDLDAILRESGMKFNIRKSTRENFVWYILETKSKRQIKLFHEKISFGYPEKRENLRVLVESFEKRPMEAMS